MGLKAYTFVLSRSSEGLSKSSFASDCLPRDAMVWKKHLENAFDFFQVQRKIGDFVIGQGNMERT